MDYLRDSNNLYDLAIQLDFCFVLRIGELLALKWSDIEGNQLHVQRSLNLVNEVHDDLSYGCRKIIAVDHIKGNASEGFRYEPITNSAASILQRIGELGLDSEYIFSYKGSFLLTDTFNERLKKVCNEIGIPYKSSHKIRFTTASMLYEADVSTIELQRMLGHTTQAMTMHYLRRVTSSDGLTSTMNKVL